MAPQSSNLLAAAYPADSTETANRYPIPGYGASSNRSYSFSSGVNDNSTWWNEDIDKDNVLDAGEDVNGNGVLDRSKFPDVAPDNTSIARNFTPGDKYDTSTHAFDGSLNDSSGYLPMLPGMSKNTPQRVARSLWYRTSIGNSDTTGDSSRVGYGYDNTDPRNLFIYNTSYNSSTTAANGSSFNRKQPAPLILPETVCINAVDGTVDRNCASGTLNLNLPANSLFPNGGGSIQPASSFTVCGVTGNSRKYQSVQIDANNITAGSCPSTTSTPTFGAPRTAIVNFYTGLRSLTTGQPVTFDTVATTPANTQFSVSAVSNTKVNVLNLTAANFESLRNEDLGEDTNGNGVLDKSKTLTLRASEDINKNGILDTGEDFNGNSVLDVTTDPTFLLRAPDADVTIDGLYVKLDGVDPNKVFWVFPRQGAKALTIGRAVTDNAQIPNIPTTVLTGNFIGNMPATGGTATTSTGLNFGETIDGRGISIRGARFLGFRARNLSEAIADAPTDPLRAIGVDPTAMITAMTTVNQPVVVPVLQIHAPVTTTIPTSPTAVLPQPAIDGEAKYTTGINGGENTDNGSGQWTQRVAAPTTTVNIYFVAGNTPSRAYVPYTTSATAGNPSATIYTAETGGGLQNFVRFSENWTGQALKISGGFIQNTRSTFATGPFSITAPYTTLATSGCVASSSLTYAARATCIDTSSDVQTWFTNPAAPNEPLSNFSKYVQSITTQSIPYYSPPRRLWGFDVGLLVQQPDLFAQRFSQAKPGFSEFFRETNKEDRWVRTMLCALQPAPTILNAKTLNATTDNINIGFEQRVGTKPSNYNTYALGIKDRPSECDTLTANRVYSPTS